MRAVKKGENQTLLFDWGCCRPPWSKN